MKTRLLVILLAMSLASIIGHYTSVSWSGFNIGTNNSYCGVYIPHANAYCEHAS